MKRRQHDHAHAVKNADYLVWRILKDKREGHAENIRHAYNMRARNTHTRH